MPNCNGYDFTKALRTQPNSEHIPVFMLASLTDSDSENKALSAGINKVFTKPIDWPMLTTAILSAFNIH
jgi:PleD family two-component response regulator